MFFMLEFLIRKRNNTKQNDKCFSLGNTNTQISAKKTHFSYLSSNAISLFGPTLKTSYMQSSLAVRPNSNGNVDIAWLDTFTRVQTHDFPIVCEFQMVFATLSTDNRKEAVQFCLLMKSFCLSPYLDKQLNYMLII